MHDGISIEHVHGCMARQKVGVQIHARLGWDGVRQTIEIATAQCYEIRMNLHKLRIQAPVQPVSSGTCSASQFWHQHGLSVHLHGLSVLAPAWLVISGTSTTSQFWHLHGLSVLAPAQPVNYGTTTTCLFWQLHGLSGLAPARLASSSTCTAC